MPLTLYQPDGGFIGPRLSVVDLFGLLIAMAVGALYGHLGAVHSLDIFGFVLFFGGGQGLGWLLDRALRWAHNRNAAILYGLAVLFAAAWAYAGWAAFFTQRITHDAVETPHLVIDPIELFERLQARAYGVANLTAWHAGGPRTMSVFNLLCEVAEFAIFLGMLIQRGRAHLKLPYFAAAHDWGQVSNPWGGYWRHTELTVLDRNAMLEDEAFQWVDDLEPTTQQEGALSFWLYVHPTQTDVYLTVLKTRRFQGKRGPRFEDLPLVANIHLESTAWQALEERFPYESDEDEEGNPIAREDSDDDSEGDTKADAEADTDAETERPAPTDSDPVEAAPAASVAPPAITPPTPPGDTTTTTTAQDLWDT